MPQFLHKNGNFSKFYTLHIIKDLEQRKISTIYFAIAQVRTFVINFSLQYQNYVKPHNLRDRLKGQEETRRFLLLQIVTGNGLCVVQA